MLRSAGTGLLNGRSEQLLGQFIAEAGGRAQHPVLVASKFAAYPWRLTAGAHITARNAQTCEVIDVVLARMAAPFVDAIRWWPLPAVACCAAGRMVAACRGSLRRLGAKNLALGQLHWSAARCAPGFSNHSTPLRSGVRRTLAVPMYIICSQLHACVAHCRYAPLQERALWDGLAAIHNEVSCLRQLVMRCVSAQPRHEVCCRLPASSRSLRFAVADVGFCCRAWSRRWGSATMARGSCSGYTGRELH